MPLNPKQTAHSLLYSLAVELEHTVARGGERDCRGLLNNGKVSNIYLSWLIIFSLTLCKQVEGKLI